MLRRLSRRLEQRRDGDAGFTLIELVVAMMVTLLVMTALLGVFVESLSTVSQSKQRQAATGLATQVMEQLRALPYDDVTKPTTAVAPAGDPNIAYETPPKLRPAALPGVNEPLVVNTVSPKLTAQSIEGVVYRVRQYVAKAPAVGTEQPYTLTVIVTWSSNASGGTKTTVERSAAYSASGCLSTATRPFSGPCQASFTAQAGQSSAGVTISHPADSDAPIAGFDGRQSTLALPLASAALLLEQTTNVTSSVKTSGATITQGDTLSGTGELPASTTVDSDPSSTPGQSESEATPGQTAVPRVLTGTAGTLSATPGSSDAGTSGSAVAAEPAQCPVGHSTGTALTTGVTAQRRPCGTAQVQAAGSPAAVSYQLPSELGGSTTSVVSIGASPSATRATAAHLTASNTDACPGANGAGCAYAGAYRALGPVVVGGLPAGAPAGFSGSWKVDGLVESARAERGSGSRAPAYTRSGTVRWWTGAGYSAPLTLTPGLGQDITVPTATWSTTSGGQLVQIDVSSVLRIRPAQVPAPTGPADCQATACFATASAPSGISGETTYVMSVNGVERTRFLVRTDLGGLLAEAAYKAAPSA